MDVVLVGLPGSGKSAVGRRLARRSGATFIDLDEVIEHEAGRPIPTIFAEEGEAGFRGRERAAVCALGPPDPDAPLRRVIATGGGAPIDPANRWRLYRGRLAVWLDGPPEVLAQRLHRSPAARPLVSSRDPIGTLRGLAGARARYYAAALHINGIVPVQQVVEAIERHLAGGLPAATMLLRAETPIGNLELGHGIAGAALLRNLGRLDALRAIVISEPGAWAAFGAGLAAGLERDGLPVARVLLPEGESAKRLSVVEQAARELAALRAERAEPIVAIGGGALGDAAGFLAATYLRGLPLIHVPTTLVAQIDSAIGGKTALDLPEGKNLIGAFHQPAAIVVDTAALETLPKRHRRAALGEAVKMGILGDERILELLEESGEAIVRGAAVQDRFTEEPVAGATAELVERCAWSKVEVVLTDERERGARITLNLGHSIGHAIEAAAEYRGILHGEAVAYGLRAAARIGLRLGVTTDDRAERIEALLSRLSLAVRPLPYSVERVLEAMSLDKKHHAGQLRWVLPAAEGVVIRSDVPLEQIGPVVAGVLAANGVPGSGDGPP